MSKELVLRRSDRVDIDQSIDLQLQVYKDWLHEVLGNVATLVPKAQADYIQLQEAKSDLISLAQEHEAFRRAAQHEIEAKEADLQDAESQAKEAVERLTSERSLLEIKAEDTEKLLEDAHAKLEDTQVALDTYKQQLIVTDAQSSELHAKLEAAEDNISASQEAARVAHQRKVEAEEKAAHLQEQLKELLAKAKHSVSRNTPRKSWWGLGNIVSRPSTAPPLLPEDTAAGSSEQQEAAGTLLPQESEEEAEESLKPPAEPSRSNANEMPEVNDQKDEVPGLSLEHEDHLDDDLHEGLPETLAEEQEADGLVIQEADKARESNAESGNQLMSDLDEPQEQVTHDNDDIAEPSFLDTRYGSQEFEGTDGLGVLDDLPPFDDAMQPEEAAASLALDQSEQAEPAQSAPELDSAQDEAQEQAPTDPSAKAAIHTEDANQAGKQEQEVITKRPRGRPRRNADSKTSQETRRAIGKKRTGPQSRKTVSKPVKEDEAAANNHKGKAPGREEVPEPSKSETGQGRGEDILPDTAPEHDGGNTSEEAIVPRRLRNALGTRPRKTSSKLKEATADNKKIEEMADLKTEGLSRRKAAPRSKKAAKKPVEGEKKLEEDTTPKGSHGKIEEKEMTARKKRATKEASRAVSTRTRSHARAERLDDGDAITSPPRLGEPGAPGKGAAAKPQNAKRGRSQPGTKAEAPSQKDSKRQRGSKQ